MRQIKTVYLDKIIEIDLRSSCSTLIEFSSFAVQCEEGTFKELPMEAIRLTNNGPPPKSQCDE